MKNFWLDRKNAQRGIQFVTRSGHTMVMCDEAQELPPWNTDAYQGFDFDTPVEDLPKTTWPKIYGWKTPDKHTIDQVLAHVLANHTEMTRKIDENDFVDLSNTTQHNSRYKEYQRLRSGYGVSLQMKDEEPKPAKRWKRVEILSSMGCNWIMKDNSLPCGQWTNKENDGRISE